MKRIVLAALASVAVILASLTVLPAAANASTAKDCAAELGITVPSKADAKQKTPVILVHGLWGSVDSWGDKYDPMDGALDDDALVVKVFDYKAENATWVTSGSADKRLAQTIVCYSKLYGNKKVVIVAHSMGGLLTRAALEWPVYGTFTKRSVGRIITIGTPHKGAALASISGESLVTTCNVMLSVWGNTAQENCRDEAGTSALVALRPGSPELAALPKFPKGISVEAIAGNIQREHCILWSCSYEDSDSDSVVNVKSATAEYTTTGFGDGVRIFSCHDFADTLDKPAQWCSHSGMLKAPQVQSEVKISIQSYINNTPTPLALPDYTMLEDFFHRFSLPFLYTWEASGSSPNAALNVADLTSCMGFNNECPHITIIDMTSDYAKETYSSTPVIDVARESCSHEDQSVDGWFEELTRTTIGGEKAYYSKKLRCLGSASVNKTGVYVWEIPSHKLLVIAYDTPTSKVAIGDINAVLDSIKWK